MTVHGGFGHFLYAACVAYDPELVHGKDVGVDAMRLLRKYMNSTDTDKKAYVVDREYLQILKPTVQWLSNL
jgi:hypothetical protein